MMRQKFTSILLLMVLLLQFGGAGQVIHELEVHAHDVGCAGHHVEGGGHDDSDHTEPAVPFEPTKPHESDDCSVCLTLIHTTATPLDLARAGVWWCDVVCGVLESADTRPVIRSTYLPTGRGPPLAHL